MEKDTELDVDGGVKEKLFFFEGNRIVVDEKDVKDFLTKYPKAEPMESFLVGQDTVDVPSSDPNVVKGFKDKFPDAKPLFQDSDTTDVPSGPPIPPTRGEINQEDIPVVSMGEDGEVTPVVKLDKKTRDIFVDHATKLPDNIKLDGTRSNIFINQT